MGIPRKGGACTRASWDFTLGMASVKAEGQPGKDGSRGEIRVAVGHETGTESKNTQKGSEAEENLAA